MTKSINILHSFSENISILIISGRSKQTLHFSYLETYWIKIAIIISQNISTKQLHITIKYIINILLYTNVLIIYTIILTK